MSARIAVLGLGEAGAELAVGLAAAGAVVQGFDPVVDAPDGVENRKSDADAVDGAELILSVNTAADALPALRDAAPHIAPGAVWADLNTGSARLKRELAATLAEATPGAATFADVALMTVVPGRGAGAPMLASGDGARRFHDLLEPLRADVTVVEGGPGEAATRKLLRSVFFKGMAAAVVEAVTAARAAGLDEWLRANIADELAHADAGTVEHLIDGSVKHAERRAAEMAAAAELVADLGVEPRVARATRDQLAELAQRASGDRPTTADVVQVTTVCDSADTLHALVRDAVAARLAACGQVDGPLTSTYWWQGALETATEWRATLKTTSTRADALETFLLEHHPYDLPEVLRVPVTGGNPAYLDWVRAEVEQG